MSGMYMRVTRALLSVFCLGLVAEHVRAELLPYEEAVFYVRSGGGQPPAVTGERQKAPVVLLTGSEIRALQAKGEAPRVLKRKYTKAEYDFLARKGLEKDLGDSVLANEALRLTLSDNGNFVLQREPDGKYLTFPSFTSAFSVNINGHEYCNEYSDLVVSEELAVLGNTATITYATDENVDIVQEFALEGEACVFRVRAINRGAGACRVQVRYQIDTQIHENDGAPLYAQPVGVRVSETEVAPLSFSQWQSWLNPVQAPGDIYGVGTVISPVARIVFAWWPDAVDSVWDYTPDPEQAFYQEGFLESPESDSCVLYYMDMGVVAAGASGMVSTSYGTGSAAVSSRERLIEALQQLAAAGSYYQRQTIEVAADATAETVLLMRRDHDLSKLATDFGLDLVAGGTLSRTAGKFFANSADDTAKWFIEKTTKKIAEKAALKGVSLAVTGVGTWVSDAGSVSPDWSDEQAEAYIASQISALLAQDLSRINDVVAQTIRDLPDPLPDAYPLAEVLMSLESLRNNLLTYSPRSGYPLEDVVYWSVPGLLDFDLYGNYNPVLLGVSSEIAESHKRVVPALMSSVDTLTHWRRGGCLTWVIGGGAVKAIAHFSSAATGLGAVLAAAPIESWYWGGVTVCGNIGVANTVADIIANTYALFQFALDMESFQSDIEMMADLVGTVCGLVGNVSSGMTGSRDVGVDALTVADVEFGLLEVEKAADATLRVHNRSGSAPARVRTFTSTYAKNGGSYDELVGTGTDDLLLAPGQEAVIRPTVTVPGPGLLNTDRYFMECRVVTSAGVSYKSAFFKACSPFMCLLDDQLVQSATGLLGQGQQIEGGLNVSGEYDATEIVLSYPGSDLDLHLYDADGKHVGVNYQTGQVETNIPGVVYSGAQSKPEVMRLPKTALGAFTYKVVNVQSDGDEPYDLLINSLKERAGTLAVSPLPVRMVQTQGKGASTWLTLKEAGGWQGIDVGAVTPSDFRSGSGDVIQAHAVACVFAPTTLAAGEGASFQLSVAATPVMPVGVYSGEVAVAWNGTETRVPAEIVVQEGATVFTEAHVAVSEAAGAVELTVHGGKSDQTTSVAYWVLPGTATASRDYLPPRTQPQRIAWTNRVGTQTLSIPITTDALVEDGETFYVLLSSPVNCQIGDPCVCTVTVTDMNRADTLADAVDNVLLKWTTGGAAAWAPQGEVTADGEDAAASRAMDANKVSFVQTSVMGTGTLSFAWSVAGQGVLRLYDGRNVVAVITNAAAWDERVIELTQNTTHPLKWEFTQGGDATGRAYLDQVAWRPGGKAAVAVTASADNPEGGVVSGTGVYYPGAKVPLNAKPRPGWLFTGWTPTNLFVKPLTAAQTLTVGGSDISVTAAFAKVPLVMGLPNPPEGGTVTGSGLCMPGKSVTLKATAARNWWFMNWSDGVQTASRSVRAEEEVTLFAEFKLISQIAVPMISTPGSQSAMVGVPFRLPLHVISECLPTVKVTGLPAGLKFDAATRVVSGVPTAVPSGGIARVKVSASNPAGAAAEVIFAVTVTPLAEPAQGTFGGLVLEESQGAEFVRGVFSLTVSPLGKSSAKVTTQSGATSFTGASWSSQNDGVFRLTLRANKGETLDVSLLTGAAWSTVSLQGTLTGGVFGATALQVQGQRNAFLAKGAPGYAASTNLLARYKGYYTAALPALGEVDEPGAAENRPSGSGYLTLTVKDGGAVLLAGKLADGTALSGSTTLIALGAGTGSESASVPVFFPLYSARGVFAGLMELEPSESASPTDNVLVPADDFLQSWRYPGKAPTANPAQTEDRFSLALGMSGGYYSPVADLLAYYSDAWFTAQAPGVQHVYSSGAYTATVDAVDAALPEVQLALNPVNGAISLPAGRLPVYDRVSEEYVYAPTNPAAATLAVTKATGVFTGKFNIYYEYYDQTQALKLKTVPVSHAGVLTQIRDDDAMPPGLGFYLVPDTWKSPEARPVVYPIKRSYGVEIRNGE